MIDTVTHIPGVRAASPFTIYPITISADGRAAAVLAKGIDPDDRPREIDDVERLWRARSIRSAHYGASAPQCSEDALAALPGIVVGQGLADSLSLSVGACVELAPTELSIARNRLAFRVVAEERK